MFGGLSWSSRNNTGAGAGAAVPQQHDDGDSACGPAPASAAAPQTPPRSSALSAAIGGNGNGQGHNYSHGHGDGPSHSRECSLDEASMSDLTSTSYQQPHPQASSTRSTGSNSSPAVSELTEASHSLLAVSNDNDDDRSPSMPALPSMGLGLMSNLHAIRRPARITSRLESIPSVGYVHSHDDEEPGDDGNGDGNDDGDSIQGDNDCSNSSMSSSSPQHLMHHDPRCYSRIRSHGHSSHNDTCRSNADKFSHHLQRYNDHVDRKLYHPSHKSHHPHVSIQTDVTETDLSTVEDSYSESEWSTPLSSSHSNLAVAAASASVASASRSSSCDTSSSTTPLRGLPHAHAQPHPLHSITSFNTSATDGDIDTDMDEDSLLHHYSHHSQQQQQQGQQQRDRPLSPVLPAGSMTNRPPSRLGERASSRAMSPPTPRSVTTTTSATPRATSRSYHSHQHSHYSHQQPQQHQHQSNNRPPSRAGSISRPRYAVEFRHRPTKNASIDQHQHPSPVATEAAARAQAEYGRDGRHVERVVMDVDDPYLSHGSSADDLDVHMEEGGNFHHHSSRHHHKLRRSDAGLAPLPTPTSTVNVVLDMHGTGSTGHGHSGKLMSNLFGTLFRTIRTTLLLGAVGATVTLLRAHFLLASGGAAASVGGVGGAAATIFGSSVLASQGLVAGGGIAAVRLASGALALPKVTDLLLTAAVREAARAERAVLREKVQRIVRMLPDGRPVSVPGNGKAAAAMAHGGGRRLSTRDGAASANGETYAVRLSTTPGRSDLTDAAVERLAQCPSIADVRLGRSSDSKDYADLLGGWGDAGSIIKRPGLTTDAVLLLEDDLAFTCEELDRGKLHLWNRSVFSLLFQP